MTYSQTESQIKDLNWHDRLVLAFLLFEIIGHIFYILLILFDVYVYESPIRTDVPIYEIIFMVEGFIFISSISITLALKILAIFFRQIVHFISYKGDK